MEVIENWKRSFVVGSGVILGAGVGALWRWKNRRLAELAAGSELVETDRGIVEVTRRGSGYPVLVLHGDPGGYDQGLLFGETLFGDAVEIIAPSRPGYLRTPIGDDGTFEGQAARLVALLDALNVTRPIVVGISGGGPVALQLAVDHPDRVAGLVLGASITNEMDERMYDVGNPIIDPVLTSTPVLDARSGLFAFLQQFAPDRLIEGMHSMLSTLEGEQLDAYVDSVKTHPEHYRMAREFISTILPASARIDGTLNDERWFRELPVVDYREIECPVLVVHGEFDAAVPIAHAEFLVESLSDVELIRVEADHLVGIGPDADRVRSAIRSFTESLIDRAESTEA